MLLDWAETVYQDYAVTSAKGLVLAASFALAVGSAGYAVKGLANGQSQALPVGLADAATKGLSVSGALALAAAKASIVATGLSQATSISLGVGRSFSVASGLIASTSIALGYGAATVKASGFSAGSSEAIARALLASEVSEISEISARLGLTPVYAMRPRVGHAIEQIDASRIGNVAYFIGEESFARRRLGSKSTRVGKPSVQVGVDRIGSKVV